MALGDKETKRRNPTITLLLLAGLGVLLMIAGTLLRAAQEPAPSEAVPVGQSQGATASTGPTAGGAGSPGAAAATAAGSALARSQVSEAEAYRLDLCARVASILSAVSGAGAVRVEITLEAGHGRVYATDSFVEESKASDSAESRRETTMVLAPDVSGKGQSPIQLKEEMPKVAGVLVVASGAADSGVRLELAEAAATLLGVGAHRVKVVAASTQGR